MYTATPRAYGKYKKARAIEIETAKVKPLPRSYNNSNANVEKKKTHNLTSLSNGGSANTDVASALLKLDMASNKVIKKNFTYFKIPKTPSEKSDQVNKPVVEDWDSPRTSKSNEDEKAKKPVKEKYVANEKNKEEVDNGKQKDGGAVKDVAPQNEEKKVSHSQTHKNVLKRRESMLHVDIIQSLKEPYNKNSHKNKYTTTKMKKTFCKSNVKDSDKARKSYDNVKSKEKQSASANKSEMKAGTSTWLQASSFKQMMDTSEARKERSANEEAAANAINALENKMDSAQVLSVLRQYLDCQTFKKITSELKIVELVEAESRMEDPADQTATTSNETNNSMADDAKVSSDGIHNKRNSINKLDRLFDDTNRMNFHDDVMKANGTRRRRVELKANSVNSSLLKRSDLESGSDIFSPPKKTKKHMVRKMPPKTDIKTVSGVNVVKKVRRRRRQKLFNKVKGGNKEVFAKEKAPVEESLPEEYDNICEDELTDVVVKNILKRGRDAIAATSKEEVQHAETLSVAMATQANNSEYVCIPASPTAEERRLVLKLRRLSASETDGFGVNLKPWLDGKKGPYKNKKVAEKMLHPDIIQLQYKCMGIMCSFGTKDIREIFNHYGVHEKGAISNDTWLQCCYCEFEGMTKEFLISHLNVDHGTSPFQCPYCFYRSISETNLITHQNMFHYGTKHSYLVCLAKGHDPNKILNEIEKNRRIYVRPFVCTECNLDFYICEFFIEHMQKVHDQATHLACHICMREYPKDAMIQHYASHNMGVYECIHCSFGTNDLKVMESHLSRKHPTKMPHLAVRLYKQINLNFEEDKHSVNYTTVSVIRKAIAEGVKVLSSDKLRAMHNPNGDHDPSAPKKSFRVLNAPTPLNIVDDNCTLTEKEQEEIDNIASELIQGCGVNSNALFRCGASNCHELMCDATSYEVHLRKTACNNQCFHCKYVGKSVKALITHLLTHGIPRFFCFFCCSNFALLSDVRKHMIEIHKVINTYFFPLNPEKEDLGRDFFVTAPCNTEETIKIKFYEKLVEVYKHQQRQLMYKEKTIYSPDEIHILPVVNIFPTLIKCSICTFSTKVRSNFLRHLNSHLNNTHDNSMSMHDPVNPVPCLENKDKHIDKTINFASSSQEASLPAANSIQSPALNSTAYVSYFTRYKCMKCYYLNQNQTLFRMHLEVIHEDEKLTECPHCAAEIKGDRRNIERFMNHLRFHGNRILRCKKCDFYHFDETEVTKHISIKHLCAPASLIEIVRDIDETEQSANLAQAPGFENRWKCNYCNFRTPNRNDVLKHVKDLHDFKSQFICNLCCYHSMKEELAIGHRLKHNNTTAVIKQTFSEVAAIDTSI